MKNYYNCLFELILKIRSKISTRKTMSGRIGICIKGDKKSLAETDCLIPYSDQLAEQVDLLTCYFDSIDPAILEKRKLPRLIAW